MCTPAPQMRDADTRHSVRPSMTSPRYNRTEVPWPPTIARPLPEQTLTTRPSIQAESLQECPWSAFTTEPDLGRNSASNA